MSINKALDYFKNLLSNTAKKQETRVYEKYIAVLSDLRNKDLNQDQITSIEKVLTELQLDADTGNRKKYLARQFEKFSKYLKEEFSFVIQGHYTTLGVAFGLIVGTALGIIFGSMFPRSLGISMGSSFGFIIGLIVGMFMDAEAEKQNRVLKTR